MLDISGLCLFCLSVHLSIGNDCLFWKNSSLNQDAIWGDGSGWPKNNVLDGVQIPSNGKEQILGVGNGVEHYIV